jgi:hypothetical protein
VDSAGYLTWDNAYRSKHIKNNLNPEWEEAVVEICALCAGDLDLPIQVAVYDYESNGKHVSMGQFETSVNGFVQAAKSGESLALKFKGKDVGRINVVKAEVSGVEDVTQQMEATSLSRVSAPAFVPSAPVAHVAGKPDFVDYVSGGCELNVVVAIDFTGSNGDPRIPGTLHYLGNGERNDYERAIAAIVSALAKFDSGACVRA